MQKNSTVLFKLLMENENFRLNQKEMMEPGKEAID